MRKHRLFTAVLFLLPFITKAQLPEWLRGTWHGKLHAVVDLRMVVHFMTDSLGRDTVLLDSPDQGVNGIPGRRLRITADSVSFELNSAARFAGRFKNKTTIAGVWYQMSNYPLELTKGEPEAVAEHPQTPRPPFPYTSEDVVFTGAGTRLQYGATITIPPGQGPFPAAVLITGSGPQDRDETLVGHKTFAVLADHLTRNGFVVLRVDDRGVGKTTGSFSTATSADFANDAGEALDYLLTRPEADKKKTGLIGHSEGGMIAPMLAARRKDVSFLVLLAGPGVPVIDLMAQQAAAVSKSRGVSAEAADSFAVFYKQAMPLIAKAPSEEEATRLFTDAVTQWVAASPKRIVVSTIGVYNDTTKKKYVSTMVQSVYNPWFRYFLQFNPQPYLEQLHCKLLAINGSRDIQVLPQQNLGGIEACLKKSTSPYYEVKEIPGLNHLFQTCRQCTVQEYARLDETFSPAALNLISDWLKKNIR